MKKWLVIAVALISFGCATLSTAPDGEEVDAGRDPVEDDRCGTGTCGGSH